MVCVHIISSPKLTLSAGCSNLLGQNLPADLPVKAIVFYLAVHTLQCSEASQGLYSPFTMAGCLPWT